MEALEDTLRLTVKTGLMFLEFPVVQLIQKVEPHEILWKKSYKYKLTHDWFHKSKEDFKKNIWEDMGRELMKEHLEYIPNEYEKIYIGRELKKNWLKLRSAVAQQRRRAVKKPRTLNFNFAHLRFLEQDMRIRSVLCLKGSKRRQAAAKASAMVAMVDDEPEDFGEDPGEETVEDPGEETVEDPVEDAEEDPEDKDNVEFDSVPPYIYPITTVTHSLSHILNLHTHIQEIYHKLLTFPELCANDAINGINEYVELWSNNVHNN